MDGSLFPWLTVAALAGAKPHTRAVMNALPEVTGTYGIAVICADYPGVIVGARRGSPLIVGVGEGENLLASDASALVAHTRKVIYLSDYDVATLTTDRYEVVSLDTGARQVQVSQLEFTPEAAARKLGAINSAVHVEPVVTDIDHTNIVALCQDADVILDGTDNFDTRYLINPTGRFVVGGPMGDCGLTGRKIIVDTYGGMARHGGGAFSGKDPSKVDRSAAYAMRWVAKNVVAAGLAQRCEAQVAYAIGKAAPVGVFIETFGTGVIPDEQIQDAVLEVFDLRPAAIIRDLDLLRPIYAQTAAYGHFGRELPDFTWERTDRVDALRAAAGL